MARIRKALVAGAAAGVTLMAGALVNGDQPATSVGWVALVASAAAAAVVAGFATYQVRNVGTVNGSDPVPPTTRLIR